MLPESEFEERAEGEEEEEGDDIGEEKKDEESTLGSSLDRRKRRRVRRIERIFLPQYVRRQLPVDALKFMTSFIADMSNPYDRIPFIAKLSFYSSATCTRRCTSK